MNDKKFQVGYFKSKNYTIEIKKITKKNKLSFFIHSCYLNWDYYNLRFCRKILTDEDGNEYIKPIDLNPGQGEYYSGEWLCLKAPEMNKYKI
jgi:hypothetical protein